MGEWLRRGRSEGSWGSISVISPFPVRNQIFRFLSSEDGGGRSYDSGVGSQVGRYSLGYGIFADARPAVDVDECLRHRWLWIAKERGILVERKFANTATDERDK